jgi:hypothetical protein
MDKEELTQWALKNGWQVIDGHLSLTKPTRPKEAIVRMVLKSTVVNVEAKKPTGKWEKITGESYAKVTADPETGLPQGLGFDTMAGFSHLMEVNRNRAMMAKMGGGGDPES